jgi:hypothetical protein
MAKGTRSGLFLRRVLMLLGAALVTMQVATLIRTFATAAPAAPADAAEPPQVWVLFHPMVFGTTRRPPTF